jgi:hypothetical protein
MVSGSVVENQQVDRLVRQILKEIFGRQSENGALQLDRSKRLGLGNGADIVLSVLQHKINELWPREVRSNEGGEGTMGHDIKRRGLSASSKTGSNSVEGQIDRKYAIRPAT